ncbi:hypothetical protein J8L70_10485 [Pseudoalteromonas sp. MMG010]|uniref:hypothetical protein n=1 Tax=Pseudoalteromonas sp. MMG010 TaxID=2822685 RepID=UPI001B3A1E50|nr:hypothetical protein [Pseudoalteromonas sp. MMG010]MBQ4833668.1 hypothetical protein [Pseudoalteromonas sp. MMG010]
MLLKQEVNQLSANKNTRTYRNAAKKYARGCSEEKRIAAEQQKAKEAAQAQIIAQQAADARRAQEQQSDVYTAQELQLNTQQIQSIEAQLAQQDEVTAQPSTETETSSKEQTDALTTTSLNNTLPAQNSAENIQDVAEKEQSIENTTIAEEKAKVKPIVFSTPPANNSGISALLLPSIAIAIIILLALVLLMRLRKTKAMHALNPDPSPIVTNDNNTDEVATFSEPDNSVPPQSGLVESPNTTPPLNDTLSSNNDANVEQPSLTATQAAPNNTTVKQSVTAQATQLSEHTNAIDEKEPAASNTALNEQPLEEPMVNDNALAQEQPPSSDKAQLSAPDFNEVSPAQPITDELEFPTILEEPTASNHESPVEEPLLAPENPGVEAEIKRTEHVFKEPEIRTFDPNAPLPGVKKAVKKKEPPVAPAPDNNPKNQPQSSSVSGSKGDNNNPFANLSLDESWDPNSAEKPTIETKAKTAKSQALIDAEEKAKNMETKQ